VTKADFNEQSGGDVKIDNVLVFKKIYRLICQRVYINSILVEGIIDGTKAIIQSFISSRIRQSRKMDKVCLIDKYDLE
jgi:hypothetical protein